jgi:hypothetical protein
MSWQKSIVRVWQENASLQANKVLQSIYGGRVKQACQNGIQNHIVPGVFWFLADFTVDHGYIV